MAWITNHLTNSLNTTQSDIWMMKNWFSPVSRTEQTHRCPQDYSRGFRGSKHLVFQKGGGGKDPQKLSKTPKGNLNPYHVFESMWGWNDCFEQKHSTKWFKEIVKVYKELYSGDLESWNIQILNGQKEFGLQMVWRIWNREPQQFDNQPKWPPSCIYHLKSGLFS